MTKSIDEDALSSLCEQFVHDHLGAIQATIAFASDRGMNVTTLEVREFITQMHSEGDFDHVQCWGLPLGTNDLYKKFHS